MEDEVEECVRKKIQWAKLPANVKKQLGDSNKEYERYIFEFSIKNQLRYRGSLVRTVLKDERKYYETLVHSSIQRLMLYPYHLADMIVKGLRITPFIYYVEVVALLIELEKSYDTMPNFTAADCLRLLGIGRNEYLELVAKSRSLGRRGRSKAIRSLLPRVPLNIPMQPWWRVELGYVLEADVKPLSEPEKALIDLLIDRGSQTAGTLDYNVVKTLYRRGLIYLDVPITAADLAAVPPLKGFVMNRVAGDYFETLLYKVFVSIDEHTTVAELATVLQVDCGLVKQAVSLYCRLGFARHLQPPPVAPAHPSWRTALTQHIHPQYSQISPLTFNPSMEEEELQMEPVLMKEPSTSKQSYQEINDNTNGGTKRVALLFDSTLAAYLMMGNLSPDLKTHAVTLFEVGKICDESLDSLLMELDKVAGDPEIEGEAARYLAAAACLRRTLRILRPRLRPLDLLRCEALHALGAHQRTRLLHHKYKLAVSTAPLCREARAGLAAGALPHVGPAPPEASTPWMRLYLYHVAGYGPPTLLLRKGTVVRSVPRLLLGFSRLVVAWWGAEAALDGAGASPGALPAAAALQAANSALRRGPVLLQAVGVRQPARLRHVVFPPEADSSPESGALWARHSGLRRLAARLRLARSAGYVTLADIGVPDLGCARPPPAVQLGTYLPHSSQRAAPCGRHSGLRRLAARLRLARSAGYVTLADIGVPDLGCARPPPAVQLGTYLPHSSQRAAPCGRHSGLRRLAARLRLARSAGYVTLADIGVPDLGCARPPPAVQLGTYLPHSSQRAAPCGRHSGLRRLAARLRLARSAGYVTLADIGVPDLGCARPPPAVQLGTYLPHSSQRAAPCGRHSGLRRLAARLRLARSAGYVTLADIGVPDLGCARPPPAVQLGTYLPHSSQRAAPCGRHSGLRRLAARLRLARSAGYVTLADIGVPDLGCARPPPAVQLGTYLPHSSQRAAPCGRHSGLRRLAARLRLARSAGYVTLADIGVPDLGCARPPPAVQLGTYLPHSSQRAAPCGRHSGLRRLAARLRLARSAGYVTLADIGVPDLGCARPPPAVQLGTYLPHSSQRAAPCGRHSGLRRLAARLRLARSAGYVTLADIGVPDLGCARPPPAVQLVPPRKLKDVCGIAKPVSEVSISSSDSADKSDDKSLPHRLQSPIESHFAVTPSTDSKTSSPANGFTTLEGGQLLCEELDNLAISEPTHQSKESLPSSDDLVPIHSSSTSIEDLKDKHSKKWRSKSSLSDDIVAIHSSVENLKFEKEKCQLNELLSPAEESISMFTQLSDKLTEITAEGDSGVDTAHNASDDETCKPEKWTILDLQFGIPLFDEVLCEKICNCVVDRIAKPELLDKIKEDNEFICSDVLKFVSQCQYYPGEDMGIVKRGTLVPLPRKNLAFENGRISEWTGK